MTRINDLFLDVVFYIYPSKESAINGENVGGSGFFVSVKSNVLRTHGYVYAVTNSHVILSTLTPTLRVNKSDGTLDIAVIEQSAWHHHPNGDDIAICPLDLTPLVHKVRYLPADEHLVTKNEKEAYAIGVGDECFMSGRFINHEGRQTNNPAIRTGRIAMMPKEGIRMASGLLQEAFLIEMRSIGGFSGSPVFVVVSNVYERPPKAKIKLMPAARGWLLGIDVGHIPQRVPVTNKTGDIVHNGLYVDRNTGMSVAIPAWKLQELLNKKELVEARNVEEEKLAKSLS